MSAFYYDFFNQPLLHTQKNEGKWKQENNGNFIRRFNVAGHTKDNLQLKISPHGTLKIESIKENLPTYVTTIDSEICLPNTNVSTIKGEIQHGILTVNIIPDKPISIELT
jgi:hypothetical protein